MKGTVLVLTNSTDGTHSEIVIDGLRNRGIPVFRCDVDRLSRDLSIQFYVDNCRYGFEMVQGDNILNSRSIKSVWYRRPNRLDFAIADPVQKKYAEMETSHFLEGLWAAMTEDAFWLSNPVNLERARKKVLQLKMARELGFRIPKTIVTNDPERAREFCVSCPNGAIFKAIYHEMFDYDKKSFNVPTTFVGQKQLDRLDLVRKMPSLFQEFVDKEYELRVTVVGETLFPVRIDSQAHSETAVDWRHPDYIEKLKHTPVSMPDEVATLCRKMLKKLGLAFGAFDFAVDRSGTYYFLEVNPNGQWYWIQELTGMLISDAIIDMLASG